MPNARFVVSPLAGLPPEFDGAATIVTVHFPWGSLRDAAIGRDAEGAARVVRLLAPAGRLQLLLADGEWDAAAPLDPDAVVAAYEALGLVVHDARPATFADAVAAHSSWGKRLLRNPTPGRSAWRFELAGPPPASTTADRIEP
jgi:hypothetical protein